MAPLPPRRAVSSSRRAQYSAFMGYVVASLGALLGALLIIYSLYQDDPRRDQVNIASDAARPFGEFTATIRLAVNDVVEAIDGYYMAGSKNAELKRELAISQIRHAEARAIASENARLKRLLGLYNEPVKPIAITHIVGSSAASSRRFAYIGAGANSGVRVGMTVRSPFGIIGRVLEVGDDSARVLLLTDSQSIVPVVLADKTRNVVAFADGRGGSDLHVRLVQLNINPLKVGDVLVTSGSGGFYRPGIAVATVTALKSDGALARPISDPSNANYVAIEPVWQPKLVVAAESPAEEPLKKDGAKSAETGTTSPAEGTPE